MFCLHFHNLKKHWVIAISVMDSLRRDWEVFNNAGSKTPWHNLLHWHTALLAKIHAQSFKLLFTITAIWCYQEEFGFNGLCNSYSVNGRLLLALPSAPHSSPVPANAPCRPPALHHSPHPPGLSPASQSLFSPGLRGQNWAQTSQWSLSSSQKRRLKSLFAIIIHNKTYTFTSQTSNFIKVNQSFLISSKVGWGWRMFLQLKHFLQFFSIFS